MPGPLKILILAYFITPIVLAAKSRYLNSKNILKISRLTRPIKRSLARSTKEDMLSWAVLSLAVIMYINIILISIGLDFLKPMLLTTIITLTLTSIALILKKYNILETLKANLELLKIPAGILAIGVTVFSGILADGLISESTKLDAGYFQAAQRALTTISATTIYLYLLILLVATSYFLQSAKISLSIIGETQTARILRILFHTKPNTKIKLYNEIASMIATGILILLPLTLQNNYVTQENLIHSINKLVIFSSFHANTEMCGLPKNSNVKVSILPSDKAAYAVFNHRGGYTFKIDDCKITNRLEKNLVKKQLYQL
ncbi:hypothetical protein [Pseudomonas atacamensis]|uniref:hypothetical protein n=1 Tax=Pseudomonas atacamensis TaxID=2565368 RepID=UPI002B1DD3D4|nr:hypothetical protein [Pseudomonas atacamensis]